MFLHIKLLPRRQQLLGHGRWDAFTLTFSVVATMSGPPHHYREGSNAPFHHIYQNDDHTRGVGVGDIGDANHHTVDTRCMSNSHPSTNINASFHQNYHRYPTPNTTIYPRQHQQQHHHHHHQSSTRSTTTIISGNRGYVNGRLIPPYPYPMTSPISTQPPHFVS